MEKDVPLLFNRLKAKYQEISDVSNWHSLHAASDLDQINAIIDKRGILLEEIRSLDAALEASGASELPAYQGQYNEIKSIIREVVESDKGVMNRILLRMNEIREELRAKALFRTHALPCYIKQKYAFSK